jgi:mRNA interferase RelE/StbE
VYAIKLHKRVIKFLNTRPPKDKARIKKRFEQLMQNPYPDNARANIRKMTNRPGFRLRVGDYRFLYDVDDGKLTIYMDDADNRGGIY